LRAKKTGGRAVKAVEASAKELADAEAEETLADAERRSIRAKALAVEARTAGLQDQGPPPSIQSFRVRVTNRNGTV
jgi:hypothetical protein